MRIRLKFTKEGKVKYVGHLDTMRLFQRAIKVANIPIAYSKGFSPHSLVYFALPLGVGVSSKGEYMEIITNKDINPQIVKSQMNDVLVNGITILDAWEVEEKGDSLMSLVSAADYNINIYPENNTNIEQICNIKDIYSEYELMVQKKGKKGVKEVDIKPFILECNYEKYPNFIQVDCKLLAGSSKNLNPELLIQAILNEASIEYTLEVIRIEMYTFLDEVYIPILETGKI